MSLAPVAEPSARHDCAGTIARVAVLMPVFNDQRGLERSLASLADDGARFEVFVVDDGSTPPLRLPEHLPYLARLVRLERNQGIVAALNRGLELIAADGYDYVARLDAGDMSLPGRFAAQSAFLDAHPDHALVGSAVRYVERGGDLLFDFTPPTDHGAIMRLLRYRAALAHPSIMVRLPVLLAVGGYRDTYLHGEDYDLYMRLGRTHRLANLAPAYVVMDVRSNSLSSNRQRNLRSRLRLLIAYFEPRSIHAYLGLASNLLLMLAPRRSILRLRRVLWTLRRALPRPPRAEAAPPERR